MDLPACGCGDTDELLAALTGAVACTVETADRLRERGIEPSEDTLFLLTYHRNDGAHLAVTLSCAGCLLELLALQPGRVDLCIAAHDAMAGWLHSTFCGSKGATVH